MSNLSETIKYYTPDTVSEALEILKNNADASFISGGTDIMVNKQQGNVVSNCFVDLSNISEIMCSNPDGDYYKIGAAVKLSDIISDNFIIENFKIISDAAKSVASPLIRNQATIGGNILCENRCIFYNQSELWREAAGYCLKCGGDICIATGGKKLCLSKFVSDIAPALISVSAKVVLVVNNSESIIPLEELYSGDGINSKNIDSNTILKFILIPLRKNFISSFRKLRQRKTLEFTSLTLAVSADSNNNIIIAISGIAPKPIVVKTKRGQDFEKIYLEINKKAKIINNDFFDRQYRKAMLKTYLSDCLNEITT